MPAAAYVMGSPCAVSWDLTAAGDRKEPVLILAMLCMHAAAPAAYGQAAEVPPKFVENPPPIDVVVAL
jgi:hypothetical protein